MSQRITGTVKWFDASKGYGYIDAGMNEDVFVYYQSIADDGITSLFEGDQVEFAVVQKPRGPMALEVTRA